MNILKTDVLYETCGIFVDRRSCSNEPKNKHTEESRDQGDAVDYMISEERALLNAHGIIESSSIGVEDVMDLDAASSIPDQSIYEPSRRVPSSAPPKRFHRTFWRSIGKRLLAYKNTPATLVGRSLPMITPTSPTKPDSCSS